MKSKREFFKNGILLTAVGLVMRTVGIILGGFITREVGAEGVGLNALVMNVYSFALTFSTAGISLTVTALVAAMIGRGEGGRVAGILRGAFVYSLGFSSFGTVMLLLLAVPLGGGLIGDERTVGSLYILSFSLIPAAISSVASGYFIGIRRVSLNAVLQVMGQAARVFLTVFLLVRAESTAEALRSLALGVTLTESIVSAAALVELFAVRLHDGGERGIRPAVKPVAKKALPLAISAYVRSALLTLEHSIIPWRLSLHGENTAEALASYGYLQGMALPIILYPMVLLSSFGSLLVPEFAEARAAKEKRKMERIASRALSTALFFASSVAVLLFVFSEELGYVIYDSPSAGSYIALLAPVVPIMYLDHIADSMLKGIGEEVYSMWVNIADSLLSLFLVFLLLPVLGIAGYAVVIIAMEGFNFILSVLKLGRRVKFRLPLLRSLGLPAALMLASALITKRLVAVRGGAVTPLILFTEGVMALSIFFASLTLIRLIFDELPKLRHRTPPSERIREERHR